MWGSASADINADRDEPCALRAALQREPVTMDKLHELREQSLLDQMLRYETGA